MMISQRMAASGTGHQTWTSFDLEFSMLRDDYSCLTAIRKCCAPAERARNMACTTNALRRIVISGYDQFLSESFE